MQALSPVQAATYALVKRFVERQQLSLQALRDLRPDLLEGRRMRLSKEEVIKRTMGHWEQDGEWEYFIHGRGCRLTNIHTGEPVEWNAPDITRFDPYWFANWVDWFIQQEHNNEDALLIRTELERRTMSVRDFVLDVLEQIRDAGLLNYFRQDTKFYGLIGERK